MDLNNMYRRKKLQSEGNTQEHMMFEDDEEEHDIQFDDADDDKKRPDNGELEDKREDKALLETFANSATRKKVSCIFSSDGLSLGTNAWDIEEDEDKDGNGGDW